jgi:hypothetical protein
LKAIKAREGCIQQIRKLDEEERQRASLVGDEYVPPQPFLSDMANLIQNLRSLSIHVVEQIVLWRD